MVKAGNCHFLCVHDRFACEILQVHSPYSSANGTPGVNGYAKPADDNTIVISDSDDEEHAFQSPIVQVSGSVGERSSQHQSLN